MDADNLALARQLVSSSYVSQGGAALAARRKMIKSLLSNKRLPQTGWDEATIEMLIQDAALMDSNTFPGQVGLGEREGRVVCPMVARRHYRLAHGIGRSGDIAAEQPKAAGSSLLAKLTARLAGDALRLAGLLDLALPLVLPCATGMTLTLVLLAAAAAAPAAARIPVEGQISTKIAAAVDHDHQQRQGVGSGEDQQQQHAGLGRGSSCSRQDLQLHQQQLSAEPQQQHWVEPCADQQQQRDGLGDNPTCSQQDLQLHRLRLSAEPQQQQQQQQQLPSSDPHQQQLLPRYVIWSRIDQKTCLKSITAANLIPVVIELKQQGDQLVTDVAAIRESIQRLGSDTIAAVVTTTSCFAPRAADDIISVAQLCHQYGIPHVINNAYGVQSKTLAAAVTAACRKGRVDAIVQSTDKNFLVPVGGAIVAAPAGKLSSSSSSICGVNRDWLVQSVAKSYPGRASISAHFDLLVTLLHLGADGWIQKLNQRELLFKYLKSRLTDAAQLLGERVLETPGNPISLGLTLDGLSAAAAAANTSVAAVHGDENGSSNSSSTAAKGTADVSFLGSMLWARNVSGTRVLTGGKQQTIAGITFHDYGCHTSGYPHPYLTAAAAIGATEQEVDVFIGRLVKCYQELRSKWSRCVVKGVDELSKEGI